MRKEEWRIAGLPAVYALKQIVLDVMQEAVRMRMSAVFYPAVWKRELRAAMHAVNFHVVRKSCRKKGFRYSTAVCVRREWRRFWIV